MFESYLPSSNPVKSFACQTQGLIRHLCAISILLVIVVGCDTDVSANPPRPDATTVGDLQARAMWRACREVVCAGAPIYAPDTTPQEAQDGLSELTDEVQYLSPADLDTLVAGEGRFMDGGTLFS